MLALFSVSISGCGASLLSSRATNPVIEDYTGNWLRRLFTGEAASTFSTTASRRVVVVKEFNDQMNFCSEPFPDVGESFVSNMADALKLSAEGKGITGSLLNDYSKSVTTQIAPLIRRTQGLQLYRDAMHNLCIDRINGWGEANYETLRKHYFDQSAQLIKEELPSLLEMQKAFVNTPQSK